ncbi:MAG: AMP-binding protein [Sagittula sp.]|uniref:AMP-binding protein n=1 Tax=Sagittula sp. TaxID=2038081 RepID=UPI0040594891
MTEELRASPWDQARHTPDHPAIIMADTGERRTYAQMIGAANRLAHRLVADGVQTGDCVAILLENRVEYVEAVWAAKQLGIYYVCLPRGLTPPDAAYILSNSAAKVLITSDTLAEVAGPLLKEVPELRAGYMMGVASGGFRPYAEALDAMPDTMVEGRPRGISMLYSSGTTGRPKGIRHALEDVSPHIAPPRHAYLRKLMRFSGDTVFLNPGPFYHTAPLRMMIHAMRDGATAVAFRKFDAEAVLKAVETYGATCGMFVPTMFIRMLDLPAQLRQAVDVSSMQVALHGSAPMSPAVKDRMIDWWGDAIHEMYGGTESIGTTVITAAEWKAHRGSVGRPSSITRIRIEGPDGAELPPGQEGLVMMTQGKRFEYHGDPDKTAEATRPDGWGTLGDIGYLDAEGYLYLTDRASNLIISGGVNIYPQEAENVLTGHPDVADVAVFGIPDPEFGEKVHALVVPRPGAGTDGSLGEDLIAFCRAEIGKIKSPRSVEFTEALPRSEAGKILKKQLRRTYWPDQQAI